MATIKDIAKVKLERYGFDANDIEIDAFLIQAGIDGGTEYNVIDSEISLKKILYTAIPELLLSPSVSEGGFSKKWDSQSVKAYYKLLCNELGYPDKLGGPKIKDISNRW